MTSQNYSPLWAMAFHCQHFNPTYYFQRMPVQRGSRVYMSSNSHLLGISCVISGSMTLWNYSLLWDMVLHWQYSNFQARNILECLYRGSRVYMQWKQTNVQAPILGTSCVIWNYSPLWDMAFHCQPHPVSFSLMHSPKLAMYINVSDWTVKV